MKHTYSIILAVLLIVALAIPAFASTGDYDYNGHILPPLPSWDESVAPYVVIGRRVSNPNIYTISIYSVRPTVSGNSWGVAGSAKYWGTTLELGKGHSWGTVSLKDYTNLSKTLMTTGVPVWTNVDLLNSDGSVYLEASTPIAPPCDGSSCPASDLNHDNICDDCGKVLTMSLRSTLLDFASSHALSFSDYPYYAVVEHAIESNKYDVYISKVPMYAEGPNYDTVYGDGLKWFQAYENSDGTFSYTGELSVTKWSGDLVQANHTIANFLEPPLAVTIQGVTGEAMEMEAPKLERTMMILAGCGVCLIALLISLVLLKRVFRTLSN